MKKRKIQYLTMTALAVLLSALIISCNPSRKYEKEESELIENFLASNPSFEQKPAGYYYKEIVTGTGELAKTRDTAFVMYTIQFLGGDTIYTNVGTTDTLIIQGVNEGYNLICFEEGLTNMRVGGKSMFLLPSALAYGTTGLYDYYYGYMIIPGYTPLLFEIELKRLIPGP